MADKTKISWADATWSPIIGCSKISAGCLNCYAERMAGRLANMGNIDYQGVVCMRPDADTVIRANQHIGKWGGNTTFVESTLTKPLHWRKPRKIFVCSMSDLFHESVPFEWIDRVFAIMALCPRHEFKVLTKRAGRMKEYMNDIKTPIRIAGAVSQGARTAIDLGRFWREAGWPPKNIHLGVTVENQDNVGRIADLIRTPAAARFISFEPLLGKVDFNIDLYDGKFFGNMIDYAFIGCESGPKARLCSLDDIRFMRGQCGIAGGFIKTHIKQIPLNGKCNKNIDEWPEEFRIREI